MKRLMFAIVVLVICGGAKLPKPKFLAMLPVPLWTEAVEVQTHTAQPTVVPRKINHKSTGWGCASWCMMCLGQHMRNMHGEDYRHLEVVKERNWAAYHAKLHKGAVYVAPKPSSGCAGGICPTPQRRFLFPRIGRR